MPSAQRRAPVASLLARVPGCGRLALAWSPKDVTDHSNPYSGRTRGDHCHERHRGREEPVAEL